MRLLKVLGSSSLFTRREIDWLRNLDDKQLRELIPDDEYGTTISCRNLERRVHTRYLTHLNEIHNPGPKRRWKSKEAFERAITASRDRGNKTEESIAEDLVTSDRNLRKQAKRFEIDLGKLLHG